jgi:hypothetical protein
MKLKKVKRKAKKKLTKRDDGSWDTSDLYKSGKNPFDVETIVYYNEREGKDVIIYLYKDKETGEIMKWRTR